MCGIAGIVLAPNREPRATGAEAKVLLARLAHRGPDGQGVFAVARGRAIGSREPEAVPADATVLLVHRRLSILDLSDAGHQPMSTADGLRTIVFNGEIYNHVELREELEHRGHVFRSRSDTEVLLAAYVEWGSAALERLVGMFAFAVLDRARGTLFLARDFFGIKPLFYAPFRGGIAFASEIGALLALGGISRRANVAKVHAYLLAAPVDGGAGTFFEDIGQLPGGHYAEVSLAAPGLPEPRRYWRVDLERRAELSFDAAAERLRELFLESVRLHTRSDVPVGSALSGGIDSSAVLMSVQRLTGRAQELHAFSFVADDPALSEERWVDIVGKASGARVHKVSVVPEELAEDLERLIGVHGEPVASTSIYAQYRVFRLARETGIKVMLDGQGADELLAGYDADSRVRVELLLKAGRVREAAAFVARASRLPGRGRLWRQIGRLLPAAVHERLRAALKPRQLSWLRTAWFEERGVARLASPPARASFREYLLEGLVARSLPELLRYEDRNSMASSVESRVPFVTPELARFVLSLPEEYILAPDGTTKSVFRRAMRGIVPDAILDRKDKIGFATPERRWLERLRPWIDAVVTSAAARALGPLDNVELEAEWERIKFGRSPFDHRVWRWVNFIRWVEVAGVDVA